MSTTAAKSAPEEIVRPLYDAAFCIVAARFNDDIVEPLIRGAEATLQNHGVAQSAIEVIRVAGAFELPLAAKAAARSGRYDGIVALGAVIRGGTPHFEYVSGECMAGLSRVALDTNVPIGNGVLTVDTVEQAVDRAGGVEGNKGAEAALAALEMVHVIRDMGV
jgi:6,7-dimethyl-8-ribityllumazine synthase